METCNLVSAVIYLENLYEQLKENKNSDTRVLGDLVESIASARNEIANNANLAGAMTHNIYNKFGYVLKPAKKREEVKQAQEYTTVAGFKLGETKEVEIAELLDLVSEIADYASSIRYGSEDIAKKSTEVISDLLKSSLGGSKKTIKVNLVNNLYEKVDDKYAQSLGRYDESTGVLTIALNPNTKDKTVVKSVGLVVIKDLIFAMTEQVLKDNTELDEKVTKLRKYAEKAYRINNKKSPNYAVGSDTYGLRSNKTFLSEVITSVKMQKLLSGMKPTVKKNFNDRIKKVFKDVVSAVKIRLGLPLDGYTLFDEAIEVVEEILEDGGEPLTQYENNVVNTIINKPDVSKVKRGSVVEYTNGKGVTGHKGTQKQAIIDGYRKSQLDTATESVVDKDVEASSNTTALDGYRFNKEGKVFTTNEGQTEAIDAMKDWYKKADPKKPYFLLQGRGGTGKTTVINVLMDELNIKADDVMFATHMHKAYKVLKDANMDTRYKDSVYTTISSILSLKLSGSTGKFVKDPFAKEKAIPSVLVIDEVSMLQSDHYRELVKKAEKYGTRIIFMGDHAQLPPVNDPDPSAELKSIVFSEVANSTIHLNQLMRQGENSPVVSVTDTFIDAVNKVEDIYANSNSKMDRLKNLNYVINNLTLDGNLYKNAYNEATGEGVLLTSSNFKDVMPHIVNDLKNDINGTKFIHFNNYEHRNTVDYTNAIRRSLFKDKAENLFIPGEPVILNSSYIPVNQNDPDKELILDNSEEFTVVSSEKDEVNIRYVIQIGRGKKEERFTELKVPVYVVEAYSKAREETFIFYVPVARTAAEKRALINKIYTAENSTTRKKLEDKYEFLVKNALSTYMAGSLSHSYVINTHKSQGSSYTNVYLDVGNIAGQRTGPNEKVKSLYVGGSRPKKRLVVVDNRPARGRMIKNGINIEEVPTVDYTLSNLGSVEKSQIVEEVNKCQSKGK